MKCLKCKGEMRQGFTTFVADTEDCCIVVRRVPCWTCADCGEVIYSAEVSANLEKIVSAAKKVLTEVAVVKYSEAVA